MSPTPSGSSIPVQELVQSAHAHWSWSNAISATTACIVTWGLCLILYGYRTSANGFSLWGYIKEKRDRFVLGLVITFAIVVLRSTNQNFDQLLAILGFRPGPSAAVSIGLAIAAFLLSIHSKPKDNDKKEERPET